ncbi:MULTISPECIES: ATP-binding protein [Sphingobacterium]|uniref:ATP-binding protein n=1 Tax=Sphingobacterium TaxID=28453 RepID=UPI00257C015A|nr:MULTISPECIES: ATP-binding protein [Sphingobacterium]
MNLTKEFKDQVAEALITNRATYSGSDKAFSKRWQIALAIYSRIKNGERDGVLRDTQWLTIGRELGVVIHKQNLKFAPTEVFAHIQEEVEFCQAYSKSMMFIDEPEIGKTRTLKYLSQSRKNCFYIDGSQCKTKQLFARTLARTIGLDSSGRFSEVKENIKYCLNTLMPPPIVMVDEFGDLDVNTLLDLKELWNGTENACGWYLVAAEGGRERMLKGIQGKKVGFRELFSRFSSKFSSVVPTDLVRKQGFYQNLVSDVLTLNHPDHPEANLIVKKCLVQDVDNKIGGLRRLEQLLILHANG